MRPKQKRTLKRIIIAAVIFACALIPDKTGVSMPSPFILPALYLAAYAIAGYDVIFKAVRNIGRGHVFDENFLMTVATVAAIAMGEFPEACAVMLFYQVGEFFQDYAVGKSRQSIADMMDIAPEFANVEKDGNIEIIDPDEVGIGDTIIVKPGERIPLDGIVTDGSSVLDTSALTGESAPVSVEEGSEALSGCINMTGTLRIRVTSAYEDSTVARILELVETASEKKARIENFITRFARYYTPAVTIGALALALIPPLAFGQPFQEWIERACIFLIVSCPCAIVISVPLGFFGGIGAASRSGILIKGSNYLEAMSKIRTLVFDKTGTLTKGRFSVSGMYPAEGVSEKELLEAAASAEWFSNHPAAQPIKAAYGETAPAGPVKDEKEIPGEGTESLLDGKLLLAGNAKLMKRHSISVPAVNVPGTVIYTALDGRYLGAIVIADSLKNEAKSSITEMKVRGIDKTVMLTGDRKEAALAAADAAGVDQVMYELMPQDKVSAIEELMGEGSSGYVGFVGDGINDAPVLMRADVGIAMGNMGSDAAIEAADIVIMDDDLNKIPAAAAISKKTMRIVRENIIFALAVKAVILVLGATGHASMWAAVFGDVGVAVIAILNSMRALKK